VRHLLSFEERVVSIAENSERLCGLADELLEASIPTCPGWSGRQLLEHVAGVFTFFSHQLATGDPERRREPPAYSSEEQSEPVEWLAAAAEVLVESLGDLGPDEPCWNWSGVDLDSGWVARRMALEVAVHRYDGELGVGDPRPVSTLLALDGIDERLEVFLRPELTEAPGASLGGPICLSCEDVSASWVVEAAGGRLKVRECAGPASAVLRGSASQLFLFSWNRIAPESLELTGDPEVARAWSVLPSG
jgi:uncharacterized protein (TIGR03083 family)